MDVDSSQDVPSHRHNYVVTAHRPTAVTQVAVGNFTSPNSIDLCVSKNSRVSIHTLKPSGLEARLDVPVYGRISALKLFKPPTRTKSLLFLLTEKYKFCVLEFSDEGKLVTVANGDVEDTIGRPAECGHICVVDEESTMIGLHMYDGHLKIIPIDGQGGLSEQAFNVRLEELKVVDLAFVGKGVLGVLYEDTKGARGVRSYRLGAGGALEDGEMGRVSGIDGGMLVGVGGGVCLVVGKQTVTKYDGMFGISSVSSYGYGDGRAVMMKAHAKVGKGTVLLGDSMGGLYVCDFGGEGVVVQRVGETSICSGLAYLDSGVVFVGSGLGDSMLVRLSEGGLEVLDTMKNLGPIVDFVCGEQGLVICGGGGVKQVRSGVGVNELGVAALEGVRRVWGVGESLVCGLSGGGAVVLGLDDSGEVAVINNGDFDCEANTVECWSVDCAKKTIDVQVTDREVRCDGRSVWQTPEGVSIQHAVKGPTQKFATSSTICFAASDRVVRAIDCQSGQMLLEFAAGAEIAALAFCRAPGSERPTDFIVAYTNWQSELKIWRGGVDVATIHLGADLARSLAVSIDGEVAIFFVGTGSGAAKTYALGNSLELRHEVLISVEPLMLRSLPNALLACGGNTGAIYDETSRAFTALNLNFSVRDATVWKDYVVLAGPDCVKFCSLDEKASVSAGDVVDLPRGLPRRLAMKAGRSLSYSDKGGMVVTISANGDLPNSSDRVWFGDPIRGEILSLPGEIVCSCVAHGNKYLIGTAITESDGQNPATEPNSGRIRIVDDGGNLVGKIDTAGPVYALASAPVGVVAGVGSAVVIYEERGDTLVPVAQQSGFSVVLDVGVPGDGTKIMVADLMRSVSLLAYNASNHTLSLISRDTTPRWLSAAILVDDATGTRVVFADSNFNLGVLEQNTRAADEEIVRLSNVGEQYCGDFINRFRYGKLSHLAPMETLIFGSISGRIGLIAPLSRAQFGLLKRLQTEVEKIVGAIGGLDIAAFRSPFSTVSRMPSGAFDTSFIDGDMVELFFELDKVQKRTVLSTFDDQDAISVVAILSLLNRLK